jgi:DNA topoisomerase-1
MAHPERPFVARLTQHEDQKLKQFSIESADAAGKVRSQLLERAGGKLKVAAIERKQRRRQPSAPFITSTLQQERSSSTRVSTSAKARSDSLLTCEPIP